MRVCVVGVGYVGLVAAACFAEIGHEVACFDNDSRKISALNGGETVIHEQFLPELLKRHRGKRLKFFNSLDEALVGSAAVFVAVGTPPTRSGEADLSYIERVASEVARILASHKNQHTIIVEKSTVPVCTNDWISHILELNGAPRSSFDVASNPEFLREGTAVSDFLYPDRIVVGAESPRAIEVMLAIYEPLTSGRYYKDKNAIEAPAGVKTPPRLILTNPRSAELIKHASNSFLSMKISFINAVSAMCEAVGADITQVCEGIGADSRIGPRFLSPGIGYGGSCFPKDLLAFRAVAKQCGYDFGLLTQVSDINNQQRDRFIAKVRKALWVLKGKRLGVLGLAFKGGTDDVRDSQAIVIIRELLREDCDIVAFDPAAMSKAQELFEADPDTAGRVKFADSAYAAANGVHALLVLTEWPEFAALDLGRLKSEMLHPIVVDGRNLFAPEAMASHGFTYISFGRPDVLAAAHSRSVPIPR